MFCRVEISKYLHLQSGDIGSILRVLHDVPSVKRESFFNEVRTCRRRVQRDWKDTAVAPAISQQDEYPIVIDLIGTINVYFDTIKIHVARVPCYYICD